MVIEPTVGRVVHYYPKGWSKDQQPLAAIVAYVHSSSRVNLAIFNEEGIPFSPLPTHVFLLQDGDEVPENEGYCAWMPYQKGQAQKTEQLEKKVAEAAPLGSSHC